MRADARLAKEKMNNQRFLAQLAADSRMSIAQLVASMKANGGPSVAQQKYLDKKEADEKAKGDAQSRSLDETSCNVDILDTNKGITNPDRNAASNLASWVHNGPRSEHGRQDVRHHQPERSQILGDLVL